MTVALIAIGVCLLVVGLFVLLVRDELRRLP